MLVPTWSGGFVGISFVELNRGREFDISSETWKTFRDGLSVGCVGCNERYFLSIWPGVEFVSGKDGT